MYFLCPTNNYFVGCELCDKPLCVCTQYRSGIICFYPSKSSSRGFDIFVVCTLKESYYRVSKIKLLVFIASCLIKRTFKLANETPNISRSQSRKISKSIARFIRSAKLSINRAFAYSSILKLAC